jgi:quercetin dioxygenase-like cupin family protein
MPMHIHDDEEEAFYILEGQLRVSCGEQTWTVGRGDFVMLPRGIPHTCAVYFGGERTLISK